MEVRETITEGLYMIIQDSQSGVEFFNQGSKERAEETHIYETAMKLLYADERAKHERDLENAKFEFEKKRATEELAFKQFIDHERISIERDKANVEMLSNIANVALTGIEVVMTACLGILYLKANMEYGGMVGKDGKNWFDQLRKIKL